MFDTNSKYVVIGDPVGHSLSPIMHNAALKALNSNYTYDKFHVLAQELPDFVDFARKNLLGFNITVPHKRAIIPFLDNISNDAKITQSVNTVKIINGQLHGYSTDGYGLAAALQEAFGENIANGKFCFVGAGGATQAAAIYFAAQGAQNIFIANRTLSKADGIANIIHDNFPGVNCQTCNVDDIEKLQYFIQESDVVIQGTSLGLKATDPAPFDLALLTHAKNCFDTIYKDTAFLRQASKLNLPFADGRGMLLHQGVKALEIWTEQDVPVEIMRKTLNQAIV